MGFPSLPAVIGTGMAVGTLVLFTIHPEAPPPPDWARPPAAPPAPAAQAAAAATQTATATPALPPWNVPDVDKLPDDAFGQTVRYGRDLIEHTTALIGPDAPDPKMRYAGSGLECASCHLDGGTARFAIPLAFTWGVFPTFIGRENEVRTMAERINGCMERSVNGRALPVDGREMKAMLTYIRYISGGEPVGKSVIGRSSPVLKVPDRAADPKHGAEVFAQYCAACHQADGQGLRLSAEDQAREHKRYQFPPLWGPDSYNDGAGMARSITAAQFIHANMPRGVTFESPALSPDDAFDVAVFINSQPRPHKANLEADYPNLALKPADAAYPPFAGPFSAEQHRFGPWGPIRQWLKDNASSLGQATRPAKPAANPAG
jgi:thiosulfate dehydrogenase